MFLLVNILFFSSSNLLNNEEVERIGNDNHEFIQELLDKEKLLKQFENL